VALDLDGTLLDCRARQVAVAVHLAGSLDEDAFWAAKRGGATTAAALAAQGAPDVSAEWVEQIEDERWLALDLPLPGAEAALAELRRAGFDPVVLTARRHANRVAAQVERLGLAPPVVVAPAAASVEKAAALRQVGAAGLIGDTESDLEAARAAGVPYELVSTGQRDAAFLRRHGAAAVHDTLGQAVEALVARIADGAPNRGRT
jgi:phosphoglycolate phosphatase-like HAD superfamily hydrolase